MFKIIKLILVLDKDNPSEHKIHFEMMMSFIEGKKPSNPTWPYVKKQLPSYLLNQPINQI